MQEIKARIHDKFQNIILLNVVMNNSIKNKSEITEFMTDVEKQNIELENAEIEKQNYEATKDAIKNKTEVGKAVILKMSEKAFIECPITIAKNGKYVLTVKQDKSKLALALNEFNKEAIVRGGQDEVGS